MTIFYLCWGKSKQRLTEVWRQIPILIFKTERKSTYCSHRVENPPLMFSFWLQRGSWKNKEAQVFTLTSNCSLKTCLRRHEPIESLPSFPQGLNIFHQFDFPIIIFQDLICTSIFKSFRSPNNLRHLFFFSPCPGVCIWRSINSLSAQE